MSAPETGTRGELGANLRADGTCTFGVWAPATPSLTLELLPRQPDAPSRLIELERDGASFYAEVSDVLDGDLYWLVFPDGHRRADPRSRRQPFGVHGPSAVVDLTRLQPAAAGEGATLTWKPAPLADWVIYELHVGTFTPGGTFDGVIGALDYLRDDLGVSAIELMPLSPFPGERNWGYDGVAPFAVQESYGGPAGLARLVDAAHRHGLAVILDVVYNHLGPEGNYLRDFGPYFTKKHHTPWGEGINFDDVDAEPVRAYFRDNALQWIERFGVDALRLDAVQMIQDESPKHIVAEIAEVVHAAGGKVIAESDLNDPMIVRPAAAGGYGLDAQWSDDLHHALHAILTHGREGYYEDYGQASDVATALSQGFVYDGSRHSSFRGEAYGKSTEGIPIERHVVCLQNHDQIGNRATGDRIAALTNLEAAKVGAAVILLSPGIPLLFMGEEYAARQPFLYFTSHSDPALAKAVRRGRKAEFAAFEWKGEVPDPQANETFERSVLHLDERVQRGHRGIFELYRALLELRSQHPALRGTGRRERTRVRAEDDAEIVILERWSHDGSQRLLAIYSLGRSRPRVRLPLPQGPWARLLDTTDPAFEGFGGRAPETLQPDPGGYVELDLPPTAAWIYQRG